MVTGNKTIKKLNKKLKFRRWEKYVERIRTKAKEKIAHNFSKKDNNYLNICQC